MDRLWIWTSVRDEEHLMPFFLRHYLTIAERVVVQDCGSTDRTQEIVRDMGGELIETEPWGMDELRRRNESLNFVKESDGKTKWCACVDADEFVIGQFEKALRDGERAGCEVLHTAGWTMRGDRFPSDDGRQIYEIEPVGHMAGAAKPVIARAGADFLWSSGRHFIENQSARIGEPMLHLLHYRYLGEAYIRSRNARNWNRSPDKMTAWGCSAEFTENMLKPGPEPAWANAVDVAQAGQYRHGDSGFAPHLDHSRMINPENQ